MNRPGIAGGSNSVRGWSHATNITVFPEVQERAVRLVQEHTTEHSSQWTAITSIAGKLGFA